MKSRPTAVCLLSETIGVEEGSIICDIGVTKQRAHNLLSLSPPPSLSLSIYTHICHTYTNLAHSTFPFSISHTLNLLTYLLIHLCTYTNTWFIIYYVKGESQPIYCHIYYLHICVCMHANRRYNTLLRRLNRQPWPISHQLLLVWLLARKHQAGPCCAPQTYRLQLEERYWSCLITFLFTLSSTTPITTWVKV